MSILPHSARLVSDIIPEIRLSLLQQHDPLREWHAVNEVRTCICCGRKLTGRTIRIHFDKKRTWFRCPTTNCSGSLADFARAGDPLLDDEVWKDWCRTFDGFALSYGTGDEPPEHE